MNFIATYFNLWYNNLGVDFMPTIKDVARLSGYSISTVSYALSDDPKIPEDTKNREKQFFLI